MNIRIDLVTIKSIIYNKKHNLDYILDTLCNFSFSLLFEAQSNRLIFLVPSPNNISSEYKFDFCHINPVNLIYDLSIEKMCELHSIPLELLCISLAPSATIVSTLNEFLIEIKREKISNLIFMYENYLQKIEKRLNEFQHKRHSKKDKLFVNSLLNPQINLINDEIKLLNSIVNSKNLAEDYLNNYEKIFYFRPNQVNCIIDCLVEKGFQFNDLYFNIGFENTGLLFRGITSFYFDEKPSIMRKPKMFLREHDIYQSFSNQFKRLFNDSNNFEKLTIMEHHNLPTRLLDLTSNPLVALYMSCTNQFSNDSFNHLGEIILYSSFDGNKNLVFSFDDPIIIIISSLPKLNQNEKTSLKCFLTKSLEKGVKPFVTRKKLLTNLAHNNKNNITNKAINSFRKLLFYSNEYDYVFKNEEFNPYSLLYNYIVKPSIIDERISTQSGFFIIYGLRNDNLNFSSSRINDNLKRIIIINKETILKELSEININQMTMFPDEDNHASFLRNKDYSNN